MNRFLSLSLLVAISISLVGCGGGGGGGGESAAPVGPVIGGYTLAPDTTTRVADTVISSSLPGSWRREGSVSAAQDGVNLTITKDVVTYNANGTFTENGAAIGTKGSQTLNFTLVQNGKYSISNGQINYSQIVLDTYVTEDPTQNQKNVAVTPYYEIVNFISNEKMKVTTFVVSTGQYLGQEYYKTN